MRRDVDASFDHLRAHADETGVVRRQPSSLSICIELEETLLVLAAVFSPKTRSKKNLVRHRQRAEHSSRHVYGVADDKRERAWLVFLDNLRCEHGGRTILRPFDRPLCAAPPREALIAVERQL